MPAWRVHLHACDKVAPVLGLNQDRLDVFKFGSLFPDMALYKFIGEDIHDCKWRLHCYYQTVGMAVAVSDYEEFYEKLVSDYGEAYKESDFLTGVLFHLVMDGVFNEASNSITEIHDKTRYVIRTHYGIDAIKASYEEYVQAKFHDIDAFARTLNYNGILAKDMPDKVYEEIEYIVGKHIDTVPNMLKIIEDNTDKLSHGTNIMFTVIQYHELVDKSIKLFIDLV